MRDHCDCITTEEVNTLLDPLKAKLAQAALGAAGYAIGQDLEGEAFVELIEDAPLRRQYRVSPKEGAPRYFSVIVKEHY